MRAPLFTIFGIGISWRDIILIGGGLFLMAKATHEIHGEIEPHDKKVRATTTQSFFWIVVQLIAVDLVFSIDSIITAIGMAEDIEVMVAAVVIAMIVMYLASRPVSDFIARHPTTKMLALAFLMLIGVALVADGFDVHVPRGYIYFAMAFAGAVELFNVLAARQRRRGDEAEITAGAGKMVTAIRVHKVGGPEVLTYEDIEVGAPGPGQIRLKQRACGVNFIDTYFRSGLYPAPQMPFIPGNEAAGEVVAVG